MKQVPASVLAACASVMLLSSTAVADHHKDPSKHKTTAVQGEWACSWQAKNDAEPTSKENSEWVCRWVPDKTESNSKDTESEQWIWTPKKTDN